MARKNTSEKAATTFKVGDLVFVKVRGYSHWPAKVLSVGTNPANMKYNVLFYGTQQTFIATPDAVVPFNEETKKKYGDKCKVKSFIRAMWEIEFDPDLKSHEKQEESGSEEEEDAEESATLSEIKQEKLEPKAAKPRPDGVRSSKRLNPPEASAPVKRKADSKSQVKAKRIKEDDDEDPIRQKYLKKEAWLKLPPEERKKKIVQLKNEKTGHKKLQKIQSVQIQLALANMATEIDSALKLNTAKSLNTCEKILADFGKLPAVTKHIYTVPEFLEAVRKCKDSEKLKKPADASLVKINSLLGLKASEDLQAVFEEKRKTFLEENKKELDKDRKIADLLKRNKDAAKEPADIKC